MHSLQHDTAAATPVHDGLRLARVLALALATLAPFVAGAAYAGTAELTHETLLGLRAYFADPANVRGMVGAALGAIVSVVAARTFAPGSANDSDEG